MQTADDTVDHDQQDDLYCENQPPFVVRSVASYNEITCDQNRFGVYFSQSQVVHTKFGVYTPIRFYAPTGYAELVDCQSLRSTCPPTRQR